MQRLPWYGAAGDTFNAARLAQSAGELLQELPNLLAAPHRPPFEGPEDTTCN